MVMDKCGTKDSNCTFDQLPVCAPNSDGYYGMTRIYVKKDKDGAVSTKIYCEEGSDAPERCILVAEPEYEAVADPKDLRKKPGDDEAYLSINDANVLLDDGWFERHGINGLCRSESPVGVDPSTGQSMYGLYGYDYYLDRIDRLVYKNDAPKGNYAGVQLSLLSSEARCLYKELDMTERDMICAPTSCPVVPGSGSVVREFASEVLPGKYLLTNDGARLDQLIEGIETLSCLKEYRKEDILGFFKTLKDQSLSEKTSDTNKTGVIGNWIGGGFLVLLGISIFLGQRNHRQVMAKMDQGHADNATVDVRNIGYKHITEDPIELRTKELAETGVFRQPYFDSGGFVTRIMDKVIVPQGDQSNYYSVGPSRSGKSASTLEGLPQAYIIGNMTDAERTAYFEKVTANMQPEEAAEYVKVTTANAEHVKRRLAENGFVGLKVVELRPSKLRGKGNAWYGNEEAILERAFEEITRFREEGQLVIVFTDEFSEARGEGSSGHVPLRQRLKKYQENPDLAFGQATTIEEVKDTYQGDTAALARVEPIFHEAPEPLEVIKRLTQRPYVKGTYGVTMLDPAAMKAVYLVGRRVDPRASSMTVAESYFTKVLQAAKDRGVTRLTFDFVREHYEKEYARQHGRYLLTEGNTDKAVSLETDEIRAENKADFDEYKELIREEAGRGRIKPLWSEAFEAEQCVAEGAEPVAARDPVDATVERMSQIPQYKRLFDTIGPERTREIAAWIDREWTQLESTPDGRGLQERLRNSDKLYGRKSMEGGRSETFVMLKIEEAAKPARAAGLPMPGEGREERDGEEGRRTDGRSGPKGGRRAKAPRAKGL